jgi:GPI-anchor transamidase subunit GAA1
VYGIVRAYRSPPVEAILVVVPVQESHIDSIALGMALQTYCREQVYWARDIIFLFTEHAEIGLEAWLAAYHGSRHSFVSADALEAHGGAIIGATVLDVVGSRFVNLNIQFNMVMSIRGQGE